MIRAMLAMLALVATLSLLPERAEAYACARGVYRAGCAGPNGAVVARRPPGYGYARPPAYRGGYYGRPPAYRGGYYARPPAYRGGYYGRPAYPGGYYRRY